MKTYLQSKSEHDEVHKRGEGDRDNDYRRSLRGSEKRHSRRKKKERQEGCSGELLELARDILCFEKHMEVVEEKNQRYGWVMKREVRWHSLQVKL